MKGLLRRMQASRRVALDVSRVLWMRREVPQAMCEKQGAILLRWDDLQTTLGGRKA